MAQDSSADLSGSSGAPRRRWSGPSWPRVWLVELGWSVPASLGVSARSWALTARIASALWRQRALGGWGGWCACAVGLCVQQCACVCPAEAAACSGWVACVTHASRDCCAHACVLHWPAAHAWLHPMLGCSSCVPTQPQFKAVLQLFFSDATAAYTCSSCQHSNCCC